MKLILFSGNHPRHLFVNSEIIKYFDNTLVIIMEREELQPSPPNDLTAHDKSLFLKHFSNIFWPKISKNITHLCAL